VNRQYNKNIDNTIRINYADQLLRSSMNAQGLDGYTFGLRGGYPDAATYDVNDSAGGTTVDLDGDATITQYAAAIASAVSAQDDDVSITLDDADERWLVGDVVFVGSADNIGYVEIRKITGITGTVASRVLHLDRALEYDHTTSEKVCKIEASLPVETADVSDGYRDVIVALTWTLGIAVLAKTRELVDFVASPLICPATVSQLMDAYPGYSDEGTPTQYSPDGYQRAIDAAWTQDVIPRLMGKGITPSTIVTISDFVPAIIEWAVWRLARNGYFPYNVEDLGRWTDDQQAYAGESLDLALANVRWMDADDDEVKDPDEADKTFGVITLIQ